MMDGSQASLSVDGAATDGLSPGLHRRAPAPGDTRAPATARQPIVCIGDRAVGRGQPVYVIAEIGINHNGSIEICEQLIEGAVQAGCNAVKFQKRTPELCVPLEQWNVTRTRPGGG